MGWCYKIFKIVVICILLVSTGLGYLKLYQLFVDINDTLSSIGEVSSIQDLAWVPYLVLQVCTTIFIFLQIYCLIRELCANDYMYKHCFRFSFTLTILIYCISVIPKSVLTIVYYNYNVTVKEWWNKLVDVLESLFNNLGALGFQIILFMRVIKKTLRSAGVCRNRAVRPLHARNGSVTDSEIDVNNSGCCLFRKSNVSKADNNLDDGLHTAADNKLKMTNGKPVTAEKKVLGKKDRLQNNATKLHSLKTTKEKQIEALAKRKKDALVTKVKSNPGVAALNERKVRAEARVTKLKSTAKQNAEAIARKSKLSSHTGKRNPNQATDEITCDTCGWTNTLKSLKTIENMNDSKSNHKEPYEYICVKCGTALIAPKPESDENEKRNCCRKVGDIMCCLCEKRTLCFIIAMALANIHILIYVIEDLFIFCPWC